jgi:hypothetical protein
VRSELTESRDAGKPGKVLRQAEVVNRLRRIPVKRVWSQSVDPVRL